MPGDTHPYLKDVTWRIHDCLACLWYAGAFNVDGRKGIPEIESTRREAVHAVIYMEGWSSSMAALFGYAGK